MTGVSSPPTSSSVGAVTRASARPARSGRPPRETTAAISSGRAAAATSAAPPPVLAPNSPIGSVATSGRRRSQSTIATRRRGQHVDVEPQLARAGVDRLFLHASADR